MQSSISAYLVALEVLALVALSMVVFDKSTLSRRIKNQNLVALFVLVLLRGILLISFFRIQASFEAFRGVLEILSILCIVAVLSKPSLIRTRGWYIYLVLGGTTCIILFLSILQGIALPWQPFASLIGVSGLNLILSRRDTLRWTHAFVPVALALASLLEWGRFIQLSQFINILGYGCFVYALFTESSLIIAAHRREVESLHLKINQLQTERRKLFEVGATLNEADGPAQVLAHMVRTLAQTIEMDQVVIINLDTPGAELAYIAALYRLERGHSEPASPASIETLFHISDSLILAEVIELRRPLCIQDPEQELALADLYGLWGESKLGPTLIQPLWFNQMMVGVLVLGNPISKRPVRRIGQTLCQQLAPQVAAAVYNTLQYQPFSQQPETPAETLLLERQGTGADFVQTWQKILRGRVVNIDIYADLIAEGMGHNVDTQEKYFARMIQVEVERIREMLKNARQIQSGSLKLNLEQVNVKKLLMEVAGRAKFLAVTKGLDFEVKLAQNLSFIQADPDKVRQIVDNLISNACRFTFKPGRIMLRGWVQKQEFDHHETDYLMIAVYDTGIGIPEKARETIFKPYYQGSSEEIPISDGLGLGLTVVKALVEAHQGQVWVESEAGQGSVFRVALPIRRLNQSVLNRLRAIASPVQTSLPTESTTLPEIPTKLETATSSREVAVEKLP